MICVECKKPKKENKKKLCKSCSLRKHREQNHSGEDFIIVEHKAGKRGIQRVFKYRANCVSCGKDKGYCFKNSINIPCGKCTNRSTPSKYNDNHQYLRFKQLTPFQGEVYVRSSFEFFYISYLNNLSIDFFYEPKIFKFKDKTTYLPDFYLPKTNEYIELKGRMDDVSQRKINQFRKEFPNETLKVLRLEDLKRIGYDPSFYVNNFQIKINGETWLVVILKDRHYQKLHPNTDAVVVGAEKKIYFSEEKCTDFQLILHEVNHCFIHNLGLDVTSDITAEDYEEIYCEYAARNAFKIMGVAFKILRYNKKILAQRFQKNVKIDFEAQKLKKLSGIFRHMSVWDLFSKTEVMPKLTTRDITKGKVLHKLSKDDFERIFEK